MFKRLLTTAVFISTIAVVNAQTIAPTSLVDRIENLPKPPNNLQQSMDQYGQIPMGESPAAFRNALDELNTVRESILKPLYEKLLAAGKGNLAGYSAEEQKLLQDVQTLRVNWGDRVMYGFDSRIEYRPGIARQFWSKPRQPLSASAQDQYNRLVKIEQSLQCEVFLEEARKREELVFHDPKLDAIDAEKIQALSAVPTKKVKFAEGSDVMVDLPDRDKMIEVMKQFDSRKLKIFERVYNEQYGWWQTNFTRITTAAKNLDALLQATNFGENLQGNDAQLRPALADVQARIVSMLHHLTNIGTKIISISQQANNSKQATEEYIRNN